MLKNKKYLITGTMLCSIMAGLAISVPNTSASTIFDDLARNSGFDPYQNFFSCVLEEYKTVNNVDDDYFITLDRAGESLPDSELANITNLTCTTPVTPGSGPITGTNGIERLTNLQSLNLSNNNLTSINLSLNTKLKQVILDNNSLTALDVFFNTELEYLSILNNQIENIDVLNNTLLRRLETTNTTVITGERAKKTDDVYTFDLSRIQFLWAANNQNADWTLVDNDEYTYNSTTKIITVSNRAKLANGFKLRQGDKTITISANPALISVKANLGDIVLCNIAEKYVNEAWDSDDYLNTITTELAAHKIENASLAKVEAFNYRFYQFESETLSYSFFDDDERPNINVGIADDSTTTHVHGTILDHLAHPNVLIKYSFEAPEASDTKTPDTGLFTNTDAGSKLTNTLVTIVLLSSSTIITFVAARRLIKRNKVRNF